MKLKKIVPAILMIALCICTSFDALAYYDTTSAIKASANTEITGKIRYASERNTYVVYPPGYGLVSLEFEYPQDVNETSWRILVLAIGNNQIINEKNSADDPVINGKKVHRVKKFRTNAGIYIVVTSFDKFNNSEYSLKINHKQESYSNTENEFTNNSFSNCPTIEYSKNYNANLYNKYDIDLFNFKTENPCEVTAVFTNISSADENAFTMQILNDDLKVIAETQTSKDSETRLNAKVDAGSYFIRVFSGNNYSNDDYQIRVEK